MTAAAQTPPLEAALEAIRAKSKSSSFEQVIADVIIVTIQHAIAPLQKRLAALEARPELKYGGVYAPNVSYAAGTLVTRNGGLWLALHETRATPGTEPEMWKLVVKSGGA